MSGTVSAIDWPPSGTGPAPEAGSDDVQLAAANKRTDPAILESHPVIELDNTYCMGQAQQVDWGG